MKFTMKLIKNMRNMKILNVYTSFLF